MSMKQLTKPLTSAAGFALGGVIAMLLRFWFLRTGIDDRGLLSTGHLGSILSYVLCFGLPVAFFVLLNKEEQSVCFSATPLSAAGYFILTIGLGVAAWKLISSTTLVLHLAAGAFGIIGAICALVAGIYAIRGFKTHPLFFCPGALFFACFLFCRYQQWSGEPEMQRYVFQLLAAALSMITLYQRSAFSVNMATGKSYLLWSRAALLMCLAAIPGSQLPVLWLATAVFFVLDGCEETAP